MSTKRSIQTKDTVFEPTLSEKDGSHHHKKLTENWRIAMLAQAKLPREKFVKPGEEFNSGVASDALTAEITQRNEHMSRPPLRTLVVNKRQFSSLPTTFHDYEDRMDRKIESTWNSIYNYYKKAKKELLQQTSKASTTSKRSKSSKQSKSSRSSRASKDLSKSSKGSRKSLGKKGKAAEGKGKVKRIKSDSKSASSVKSDEIEKERTLWLSTRALPKVVHQPDPIQRGPIADLELLKDRMDELAVPKHVTAKVSEREDVDSTKINEAVLTYEPTERVLQLAKPLACRLLKEEPIIPGAVQPDALQAKASPRVCELATPRVALNAKEADLKEDPFTISPNALKYVATPRIQELARPISRK